MTADPDGRLLVTARRRFTLLVTGSFAAALLLAGAAAFLLVVHQQANDAGSELATAVARADDVSDPPAGIYLFLRRDGAPLVGTPSPPHGLPDLAAMDATAADGRTRTDREHLDGRSLELRTVRRGDAVIQGAYDRTNQQRERTRLLEALLLAGGVGMAVVVLGGAVLGRRAVAPLGDALALQRRFVADAAHELRTPLTLLHTRLQVLQRDAHRAGRPALAAETDAVVGDSRRLGDVIDDLLLSAELPHRGPASGVVDLSAVAGQVVAAARAHAEAAGVTLSLAAADGARVRGAEAALRRAVAALVDNAVGHTGAGGRITVTVTGGDPVALAVEDTGVGLDPADGDRLFDRFARGQQVGDRRSFGLGLALVREIVTNHGGSVTADGEPGVGATFTLRLPAIR